MFLGWTQIAPPAGRDRDSKALRTRLNPPPTDTHAHADTHVCASSRTPIFSCQWPACGPLQGASLQNRAAPGHILLLLPPHLKTAWLLSDRAHVARMKQCAGESPLEMEAAPFITGQMPTREPYSNMPSAARSLTPAGASEPWYHHVFSPQPPLKRVSFRPFGSDRRTEWATADGCSRPEGLRLVQVCRRPRAQL